MSLEKPPQLKSLVVANNMLTGEPKPSDDTLPQFARMSLLCGPQKHIPRQTTPFTPLSSLISLL